MNEFISPHQNININISYNLGQQEKIPKVVFGKKISKFVKSTMKQQPKAFFKTFKKGQEQVIPAEENKKTKSTKNNKPKKKSNNLVTFPDQQDTVPRRLKTQGNMRSQITNSFARKQPKTHSKMLSKTINQHSKSVNNPPTQNTKTLQVKKPGLSQGKPKKQQRRASNKSCILYQPKKHAVMSDIQHIVSTSINGPSFNHSKTTSKKRVNSANVIRSDKFIDKLLDMSILTSQLGGSIPMNQQRVRNGQNTNNRIKSSLQGFMNSIDLRIIKKMEQDHNKRPNILIDSQLSNGLGLIQYLNKVRRIPMQKLHEKARKIQRFWRKNRTQCIVPYYSNMFFRNPVINSKIAIQNNLNQISQINFQQEQQSSSSHNQSLPVQSVPRNKGAQLEFKSNIKIVSSSEKQQFEESSISAAKTKTKKEYLATYESVSEDGLVFIQEYMKEESGFELREDGNQDYQGHPHIQDQEQQENEDEGEDDQNDYEKQRHIREEYYLDVQENQLLSPQVNQNKTSSLNIQKYKQLVKQSIQENKQSKIPNLGINNHKSQERQTKVLQHDLLRQKQRKKTGQLSQQANIEPTQQPKKSSHGPQAQNSTQSAHWNHVHNILSSNMNKKVSVMPKSVLEQLMKQSAYNKQWVEGEFNQSKRLSGKSSLGGSTGNLKFGERDLNQIEEDDEDQVPSHFNHRREGHEFRDRDNIQHNVKQDRQQQNYEQYFQQQAEQQNGQDTQKQQYNWNKYSDISKLKKPHHMKTRQQKQDKQLKQTEKSSDIDRDITSQNSSNIENLSYGVFSRSKQSRQLDVEGDREPEVYRKDGFSKDIPGLLPSGINNSIFIEQIQTEPNHPTSKTHPQNPASKPAQRNPKQKPSIVDPDNCKVMQPKNIELQDEYIEKSNESQNFNYNLNLDASNGTIDNNNSNLHKDEKWIREQMIMEDGIVEKYLDCGLDYFGINLTAKTQQVNLKNLSQQQLQQKLVQQKQQHKATLQKQHSHKQQSRPKAPKQKQKHNQQHKDDDIFSNDNPHDDDMQLVYVFNNTNQWNKHYDLEHAVKNSKRKDNQPHLGLRDQDGDKGKQLIGQKSGEGTDEEQGGLSISIFQPTFKISNSQEQSPVVPLTSEQLRIQQQIKNKRKQKITQHIITKLIQQFAYDVSIILRKSRNGPTGINPNNPNTAPNQMANNSGVATSNGIVTNFQSIRDFITKIKDQILAQEDYCRKIVENLRNNIGPTSMEILSYLRVEESAEFANQQNDPHEDQDNQEWLFVIPNHLFEGFNKKLLEKEEETRGKKLSNRFKLYTQFWHRSIFECYNECLDFQRPYGITGAPYAWITQSKLPRKIEYSKQKVAELLQSAQNRLLQLSCSSSGIIFDKPQSPYRQFNITQQQKDQMKEQKISRMLANQIIDDEYNWITYNDQITELLVDISRKIEQTLIFQISTDIKKIVRRRRVMAHVGKGRGFRDDSSSEEDQHAVFMVEDLA